MKKTLIVYFSRTGITKALAEAVAAETAAELFAIEPVEPYPGNYLLCVGQAKLENLKHARPAIKARPQNWASYEAIVLMFPIWWFSCPNILLSFVEQNDCSGKTIIPVCTYGSSGKGSSEKALQRSAPSASFKPCIEATALKDQAVAVIAAAMTAV